MRIGVVPSLDRAAGGVYQYATTMLEALADLGTGDEFVVFTYAGDEVPPNVRLPGPVVELRRSAGPLGALGAAAAQLALGGDGVDGAWRAFFRHHEIDLLLFTGDNDLAPKTGVPYVVAIHDIQHRLHPEFPEVSADGEWERREARLVPLIAGATLVLVDSEVGREDILAHYGATGIAPEAVRVLPFLPAHYLRPVLPDGIAAARGMFHLPERYLFYPAQFWPHKNHERVVEALGMLAAEGLRLPVVFVGSASGDLRVQTLKRVVDAAERAGVADLVHYLGYLPDLMMAALYGGALALVMPTFFGPTNIPVVEAFELGCPVITSDIRGIREHVGDAALLVDPASAASIAEAIRRVATEPALREDLIERGRAWLAAYTRDDYLERLRGALDAARERIGGGA